MLFRVLASNARMVTPVAREPDAFALLSHSLTRIPPPRAAGAACRASSHSATRYPRISAWIVVGEPRLCGPRRAGGPDSERRRRVLGIGTRSSGPAVRRGAATAQAAGRQRGARACPRTGGIRERRYEWRRFPLASMSGPEQGRRRTARALPNGREGGFSGGGLRPAQPWAKDTLSPAGSTGWHDHSLKLPQNSGQVRRNSGR